MKYIEELKAKAILLTEEKKESRRLFKESDNDHKLRFDYIKAIDMEIENEKKIIKYYESIYEIVVKTSINSYIC